MNLQQRRGLDAARHRRGLDFASTTHALASRAGLFVGPIIHGNITAALTQALCRGHLVRQTRLRHHSRRLTMKDGQMVPKVNGLLRVADTAVPADNGRALV